jgi:hypothetical protein
VLAGQPELASKLEAPELRQLKQRVALRCEIAPFDLPETAAYIATRIKVAGGVASRLFSREAVTLIHEYSRGIPRTISVICDNALVSGLALGQQPVDRAVVLEVCRDFRLSPLPAVAPIFRAGFEVNAPSAEDAADVPAPVAVEQIVSVEAAEPTPGFRRFTLFGSRR